MTVMTNENVKLITNPVICQSLCTMRDKDNDSQNVRIAARMMSRLYIAATSTDRWKKPFRGKRWFALLGKRKKRLLNSVKPMRSYMNLLGNPNSCRA